MYLFGKIEKLKIRRKKNTKKEKLRMRKLPGSEFSIDGIMI